MLALLPLLALWLAVPTMALAHAMLLSSAPVAGSSQAQSPTEIRLAVSEPVSLDFSTIKLYDRARHEQPVGSLGRDNDSEATVLASLPQTLSAGTYTVVWRVVSAIDGHLTIGVYAFHVGPSEGTPEPVAGLGLAGDESAPTEGASENPGPLWWILRAFILGNSALVLGGCLFTVLIVEPTAEERGRAGEALWRTVGNRFARIGAVAACLLVLALGLDLLTEVSTVAGSDLVGALQRNDLALTLLTSTRYGFAWTVKLLAAVLLMAMMLFIWVLSRRGGSGLWEIALAGGSLLLLAESLSSHAAAYAADRVFGVPLPVVSDWLHLVMASAWAGGLAYMALALFPAFRVAGLSAEERKAFLGKSVPRFSRLAILSVVTLAVTGTYNLAIHSTDVGAILASGYGQTLLIKLVIVAALVGIGAVNLLRLSPRLQAATKKGGASGQETAPAVKLRRNVRVETALVGLVLVCAGGLTLLAPPSGSGNTYAATTTAASANPLPTAQTTGADAVAETETGGYKLSLLAHSSDQGDRMTVTITRTAKTASPLTDVSKVLFRVTPQDLDTGGTSYTTSRQGDLGGDRQTWRVDGPIFTLAGGYQLTIAVQRTQAHDLKAAFRLDLSETALKASPAQVVEVRVSTEPSPPVSGTVRLDLNVVDGEGKPLNVAKLSVTPSQPSRGLTGSPVAATPVPGREGAYTAEVPLSMPGAWLLVFDVERDGLPILKSDASIDVLAAGGTPQP